MLTEKLPGVEQLVTRAGFDDGTLVLALKPGQLDSVKTTLRRAIDAYRDGLQAAPAHPSVTVASAQHADVDWDKLANVPFLTILRKLTMGQWVAVLGSVVAIFLAGSRFDQFVEGAEYAGKVREAERQSETLKKEVEELKNQNAHLAEMDPDPAVIENTLPADSTLFIDGEPKEVRGKAARTEKMHRSGSVVGLWSCGWNDSEAMQGGCKTLSYAIKGREHWQVVWGPTKPESIMRRLPSQ